MEDPVAKFESEKRAAIARMAEDSEFRRLTRQWMDASLRHRYSYNFTWLGRPIIQYPQDIVAIQEVLWKVQPDIVIETGIAHGGSLILSASVLELLGGDRTVVGVDIDIRAHNRQAIEAHPMARKIQLIQGSSIDEGIVGRVREIASRYKRPLVILDSNHTGDHVAAELDLYAPFVRKDSYVIVLDTDVEFMADGFPDRPWGKGNNPYTAVRAFLQKNNRFAIDRELEAKLAFTVAPSGYLRCVSDS